MKQSGLLLGAAAFPGVLKSCDSRAEGKYAYEPGLQLFTIREEMEEAPEKSLEKVAKLGYKLVEHATYWEDQHFYGFSVAEIKKILADTGLKMKSGHYALRGENNEKGTILGDWKKAVEDAKSVGLEYMVCPYLEEEDGRTLDDFKRHVETFNKAGEVCKEFGIQFCYHNHNFEFKEENGQTPFQYLLEEADEDLVKLEMDIFWINRAGKDPVKLFEENPGRFPLWHVKGMKKIDDQGITDVEEGVDKITEVGNGVIDWPNIFAHAEEAGLKYFFVEQDITPGDPFNSIKKSLKYLKKNILKA